METYLIHIINQNSNNSLVGLILNFLILSQNKSFVNFNQKI